MLRNFCHFFPPCLNDCHIVIFHSIWLTVCQRFVWLQLIDMQSYLLGHLSSQEILFWSSKKCRSNMLKCYGSNVWIMANQTCLEEMFVSSSMGPTPGLVLQLFTIHDQHALHVFSKMSSNLILPSFCEIISSMGDLTMSNITCYSDFQSNSMSFSVKGLIDRFAIWTCSQFVCVIHAGFLSSLMFYSVQGLLGSYWSWFFRHSFYVDVQ